MKYSAAGIVVNSGPITNTSVNTSTSTGGKIRNSRFAQNRNQDGSLAQLSLI